jgi:hypothetical protein
MRRVRGVVHGPATGLTPPQEGGRPALEAALPLALFTRVRGRSVLRTSGVGGSRKYG